MPANANLDESLFDPDEEAAGAVEAEVEQQEAAAADDRLARLEDELKREREAREREREAREQQMVALLTQRPQQVEAFTPPPEKPDFSNMPDPTADPDRYATEYWARQAAFEARRAATRNPPAAAPTPNEDAMVAGFLAQAGHPDGDRELAEGVLHSTARKLRAEGIDVVAGLTPGNPLFPIVNRRLVEAVKAKLDATGAAPKPRTAGTGGGSPPPANPGHKPVPKYPSGVEVLKSLGKKRGHY